MVGTQLALSDALRPGAQGHPGVCRGSPSGLLPLQGLPAGRPQGSDQGVGDRNGGQPRGGHSGSLFKAIGGAVAAIGGVSPAAGRSFTPAYARASEKPTGC